MFSHVTYVTPLMLHATKSYYPLLLYILVLFFKVFMNYNTNVVAHLPPIIFECSLCSQDVDNCYICYLS